MGNRVVKFRGKRVDNGEWAYGGYDTDFALPVDKRERHWIKQAYHGEILVNPATVGQNTGLKDKNGVEIYEGDILRNVDNPFVDKLPFKVEWNEYYGAWFWWSLLGEAGTDHLYQNIANDCEVIGNINDNPELLKPTTGIIGYADQGVLRSAT